MTTVKTSKAKKYQPIYVIAGKDTPLVNDQCQKLLDQLIEPQQRQTSLFNPDLASISITEILDELRTLPFLADKRIVLLKNSDKFISKNRETLEKYFDDPCGTGILILTANSFPSNTKLAKKLKKIGKLISISETKAWQIPDKLTKYARDVYDKNLTTQAAEFLIEISSDQLSQLYGEIDKLAIFANDQKQITIKHIESLIGHNRLFNVFNVIDACLTGNTAQAIDKLRRMFEADKTTEYKFIGAFAFHFRRMFNAKAMLDKGYSQSDVVSRLRIWGNKNALFAQLRKVTLKQVADGLKQLCETDYAIKTGQTKPKIAAEQLVYKLSTL